MEVLLIVLFLDNYLLFIRYTNHKRNKTAIDTIILPYKGIWLTPVVILGVDYMCNSLVLLKVCGNMYFCMQRFDSSTCIRRHTTTG